VNYKNCLIRSKFPAKEAKVFTQMFTQMTTKMLPVVSVQECYVAMNPQKEEQAECEKTDQQKRGTFPQQ